MKKTAVVLGLGALLLALTLPQWGRAQFGMDSSMAASAAPMQHEIQLLIAINQAGLDEAQLGEIQSLLAGLREAHQAVVQQQQALRGFLVGWQGDPQSLEAALQPRQEQLAQAQHAVAQRRQSVVAGLKDLLSVRQGEALLDGFRSWSAQASPMASGAHHGTLGMQGRMDMMAQMQAMHGPVGQSGSPMGHHQQQDGAPHMNPGAMSPGGMAPMQGDSPMSTMPMGHSGWETVLTQHLASFEKAIQDKLDGLRGTP